MLRTWPHKGIRNASFRESAAVVSYLTFLTLFVSYDVNFVGMVIPGDDLQVKLRHVGMRDGNIVVNIETTNGRGEKVLSGSAEVSQPNTVYVFTGQGSQEPGMGMDLYNSSPAARAVWDGADAHLLAVYGFSIIKFVKDNPKGRRPSISVVSRDRLSVSATWT